MGWEGGGKGDGAHSHMTSVPALVRTEGERFSPKADENTDRLRETRTNDKGEGEVKKPINCVDVIYQPPQRCWLRGGGVRGCERASDGESVSK